MYGTVGVVLALNKQYVCLYWCVIEFEAVTCGQCSIWCSKIWGRNLSLMCSPNTLQWRSRLCVYIHAPVLCCAWTNRKYVCIEERLNLKLLFVFDVVCGRNNLTLVRCLNTLQLRWLTMTAVGLYARWIHGTVLRWANSSCVCSGVFEFEAVFCVRCSMRSSFHPDVLSKYTVMTMAALRVCSLDYGTVSCWPCANRWYIFIAWCVLVISVWFAAQYTVMYTTVLRQYSWNVWHGIVVLSMDEQIVRSYWCALAFEAVIRVQRNMRL